MNFSRILLFVFACVVAFASVSAAPKWKVFKKIEKVGRNVRDGIIKAGPAVAVIGDAQKLG